MLLKKSTWGAAAGQQRQQHQDQSTAAAAAAQAAHTVTPGKVQQAVCQETEWRGRPVHQLQLVPSVGRPGGAAVG